MRLTLYTGQCSGLEHAGESAKLNKFLIMVVNYAR